MTQTKNITAFQAWSKGFPGFTNFGSFQTTLFKAFQLASSNNQERLMKAYPEWFRELAAHDSAVLGDRSRWQHTLEPGSRFEVDEETYFELLEALPPKDFNPQTGYFEVGEASHQVKGQPVHRACWKEGAKYFTGWPSFAQKYLFPGYKRDPFNYEKCSEEVAFSYFMVNFKDGSSKGYIWTVDERIAMVEETEAYLRVENVTGLGHVMVARSGREGQL